MPQLDGIKAQIEMAPTLVADAMALRDPEAARAGSRAPFLIVTGAAVIGGVIEVFNHALEFFLMQRAHS